MSTPIRASITPPSSRKKPSSKGEGAVQLSSPASASESAWAVELADVEGIAAEGSELYAELSSRGEPAAQRALSELRMELARREATIQRLEAKLLEATSAPAGESAAPPPPLRRMAEPVGDGTGTAEREELRALRREVTTALSVAGAVDSPQRPSPNNILTCFSCQVSQLCQQQLHRGQIAPSYLTAVMLVRVYLFVIGSHQGGLLGTK